MPGCEIQNWQNKIRDIERELEKWKTRDLTLFGKVCVIKTLALPEMTHIISCCPLPNNFVKELNKILFNFIWGQRDRIKRNVLIANVEKGGVGMVDLESYCLSLKAAWITRILQADQCTWSFLGRKYLNAFGSNMLALDFSFDKPE